MDSGRSYTLQQSTDLSGSWQPLVHPQVPTFAFSDEAITVLAPVNGSRRFYRAVEHASPFDPSWAAIPPLRIIRLSAGDGFNTLKSTLQSLVPGDQVLLGSGTYNLSGLLNISPQGTAAAPIRIQAAPGAEVIINRPGVNMNIIEVGVFSPARYLVLHELEFSGGDEGIKLGNCTNVWIDRCRIHGTGGAAITAKNENTSNLFITRNEIWDTGGNAEGIYLGGGSGSGVTTGSIIALNYIHDLPVPTGGFGAGIVLRQGSSGNLIAANRIQRTSGPSLFIFGTGGLIRNIVENNTCNNTGNNGMFVLADCLVQNNLINVGTNGSNAFRSTSNSGISPTRLTVVNNTFISGSSDAVRIINWETGTTMGFANNACYSQSSRAIHSDIAPTGTLFSGNITYGSVSAGIGGFLPGNGLSDFTSVTWNAAQLNARPGLSSSLLGAANAAFVPATDINYRNRTSPHTTGAFGP